VSSGFIYIMSSQSWRDDVYKVGFSDDPTLRAKQLHTTGLPYPVKLVKTARVVNMRDAERDIHQALKKQGVHAKKEFFNAPISVIEQQFDRIAAKYDDKAHRLAQQRRRYKKEREEIEKQRAEAKLRDTYERLAKIREEAAQTKEGKRLNALREKAFREVGRKPTGGLQGAMAFWLAAPLAFGIAGKNEEGVVLWVGLLFLLWLTYRLSKSRYEAREAASKATQIKYDTYLRSYEEYLK
jgi:Meiotically Up-regulated Gene 113 (MUG113) protein